MSDLFWMAVILEAAVLGSYAAVQWATGSAVVGLIVACIASVSAVPLAITVIDRVQNPPVSDDRG